MNPNLSGVIAAVPTPVLRSGAPDLQRFLRHCRWALENGCDALNVLGSTGEATSFSVTQRAAVMRTAAEGLDRSRLMVGTGTPDLPTTVRLTRLAHELGFAAALVLPPFYYKPVTDDGLFAYFAALVAKTSRAAIPIYLYNFPQLTGIKFSPELVARMAHAFPGRIVGAKDSSGDLDYARSLTAIPGFTVFPSNETALARAAKDGYAGCISATVNISARLSAELWRSQDDAELLGRVASIRQAIAAHALVPAVKHLVGRRFDDAQWERVLPPYAVLRSEQKQALGAVET